MVRIKGVVRIKYCGVMVAMCMVFMADVCAMHRSESSAHAYALEAGRKEQKELDNALHRAAWRGNKLLVQ